MLRFILPTGSLAAATRQYLKIAGYDVPEPDRTGLCGVANGVEFWQLDRRMLPYFLRSVEFDAGLTGRDLLVASGVEGLEEVCALNFSRSSTQPTRWVLAQKCGWQHLEGCKTSIGCELPRFAERVLAEAKPPFPYFVREISGSEEQCVEYGLVQMVLVVTETGSSLRANGLEIVPGFESVFESTPVIIAQPGLNDEKMSQLTSLSTALRLSLGAKQKVMVMCDVPSTVEISSLQLPSIVAPTVAPLTQDGWNACTICTPFSEQGRVASILEIAGARGIVVVPVQGYLA